MIPSSIPIPLPGGLDVELPPFFKVRQKFSAEEMADMEKGIATDFKKAVRVSMTIDENLLREIDTFAKDQGYTRSGLVAEACRRVMAV